MTTPRFAAAVLLLASTAGAGTYSLGGTLGGGGLLVNEWSPGKSDGAATGDFEADANFSGSPLRPGLLQFATGARYRFYRSIYSQGTTNTQGWGFHVNVAGLNETAVPVQLFASRDWAEFLSNLGVRRTGATTTTSLGASTQFNLRGYPTVRLRILRNLLENNSFGSPRTVAGTTSVSVGAAYSIGTQTYNASYDTAWNSGTWAENNYHSHAVALGVTASPADGINVRLSERYYLRLPLNSDPRNPRLDDNAFNAGVGRPGPKVNTGFDYGYRHVLVSAPQAPEIEQSSHSVANATAVHLTPNADALGTAGVLVKSERLGTAQLGGASEYLGIGVSWRHKFNTRWQMSAGAGGSGGVTEPSVGPLLIGYGGTGSVGASGSWTRIRGNSNYSIAYQRNLAGTPGWTLAQRASLNAETAFHGILLNGTFLALGSRRTDQLLGTFVGRSLTLSLGACWGRYSATLAGGVSDGVDQALVNPAAPDGLFLPAPYNTETRYATLTAGANFDRGRLFVGIVLRTLSSTAPGRDEQYESGASLSASYTIGAFIFSAEERFSSGGLGKNWQRGNVFMLRASRSFAWGF